jgi:hypothetical protein
MKSGILYWEKTLLRMSNWLLFLVLMKVNPMLRCIFCDRQNEEESSQPKETQKGDNLELKQETLLHYLPSSLQFRALIKVNPQRRCIHSGKQFEEQSLHTTLEK